MTRLLFALVLVLVGWSAAPSAVAQEAIDDLDLLYPQFVHPREDAAAIKRNDLRFITANRGRTIVPGLEGHERLRRIYRTKYIKQPFRLFVTRLQNFSFNFRA